MRQAFSIGVIVVVTGVGGTTLPAHRGRGEPPPASSPTRRFDSGLGGSGLSMPVGCGAGKAACDTWYLDELFVTPASSASC